MGVESTAVRGNVMGEALSLFFSYLDGLLCTEMVSVVNIVSRLSMCVLCQKPYPLEYQ